MTSSVNQKEGVAMNRDGGKEKTKLIFGEWSGITFWRCLKREAGRLHLESRRCDFESWLILWALSYLNPPGLSYLSSLKYPTDSGRRNSCIPDFLLNLQKQFQTFEIRKWSLLISSQITLSPMIFERRDVASLLWFGDSCEEASKAAGIRI